MNKALKLLKENCTIGLMLVLAGSFAGVAYGQSDSYGRPGYDPQDPYGEGYYDDEWSESDDWYDNSSHDGYNDNDGYNGNDGYNDNAGYGDERYGDDRYGRRAPAMDVGFFYGELSPYGEWVRHPYYGWVWFPRNVRAGWRPYSAGRWVMSDYGWTWVSYEPFGWATYHYGRWTWDRHVGWLWVPGTQWAPAWVAWQHGNGYIGWAPLPPAVGFDMRVGLQLGGFSLSVGIAPRNFAFVDERRFLDTRVSGYIVPEARNVTIIRNTTNITNYTVVNNQVINRGVPVDRVERATGRRAQRLRVAESRSPRETRVDRDVVQIYRPAASKLETVKVAQRNNAGLKRRPAREKASEAPATTQRPPVTAPPVRPSTPSRPPKVQDPYQRERTEVPVPVAPRVAPAPQKVDERQFRREQQQLQAEQEKEQRELQQLQRQDKAQGRAPKSGATKEPNPAEAQKSGRQPNAEKVEQRHAAELAEQQMLRQREAEQLKNRQRIERQAAQESAAAKGARKGQAEPPAEQNQGKKGKKGKAAQPNPSEKEKQVEDQKPPR
jgi:hypothetical protein